jgi:hypothetical protein
VNFEEGYEIKIFSVAGDLSLLPERKKQSSWREFMNDAGKGTISRVFAARFLGLARIVLPAMRRQKKARRSAPAGFACIRQKN